MAISTTSRVPTESNSWPRRSRRMTRPPGCCRPPWFPCLGRGAGAKGFALRARPDRVQRLEELDRVARGGHVVDADQVGGIAGQGVAGDGQRGGEAVAGLPAEQLAEKTFPRDAQAHRPAQASEFLQAGD